MERSDSLTIAWWPLLFLTVLTGCDTTQPVLTPAPALTRPAAALATEVTGLSALSFQQGSFGAVTPNASPPCTPNPSDAPFAGASELSVDALVEQVLARNPSLAQMTVAWQAASARHPQVTSLDDPMLGTWVAPASMWSDNVDFAARVEISHTWTR